MTNDDEIRKEIQDTKDRIGKLEKRSVNDYKSEGTTLILAIFLGIFGIMGIGHFYVGKKRRGGLIFIGGAFLGLALFMLTIGVSLLYSGNVPYNVSSIANTYIVVYLVPFVILYVWQILDARKQCKKYNQMLEN